MATNEPPPARSRASYYGDSISRFMDTSDEEVLGTLTSNSSFAVDVTQRDAWLAQISILKSAIYDVDGWILFEFDVPRIGSRIDVVLISGPVVFAIEFKVGEAAFNRAGINQVWDYALDLKNFHEGSHSLSIVPILLATNATDSDTDLTKRHSDDVYFPQCCTTDSLRPFIRLALTAISGEPIKVANWINSSYRPTPTIVQAAQALYSRHSVESIWKNEAGKNLEVTSHRVEEIIADAQNKNLKIIIFVTGVPGAGKTLVGLNVATHKRDVNALTHAVFLSGNGPLVKVLTEALARDEISRLKKSGKATRKGDVRQKVKAFIQNVHHFRDAGLRDVNAPSDHVVIFDEAQRAWDKDMTASFMKRKKGQAGFNQSEPEFLINYLNRHADWSAIICLVGGGQEINRGEAGISAWLDAIRSSFPAWHVYISPELTDSEYAAGKALGMLAGRENVFQDKALHLSVSMRSFRSETVSSFVKAVLDKDLGAAKELMQPILRRYPMVLTRDLSAAKKWIRQQARGNERFGLVASSGAQRLKPHAIDVRVEIDPVHWFLNDAEDSRSSFYLEDAATEFQVQGLELDWACVTWDADLRFSRGEWSWHSYVGSKWTKVNKPERQQYLVNAYRVLLTRARQGMVIFVPPGDQSDLTRLPEFYDYTYRYLEDIGIPVL